MYLNGQMPVYLIDTLTRRMEDSGILVNDFIVDVDNGTIHIDTNVDVTENDINEILSSDSLLNSVMSYVEDLVDSDAVSKLITYMENGNGFEILGSVIASTVFGTLAATVTGAVTNGEFSIPVAVLVSLVAGVYLWVVRDK